MKFALGLEIVEIEPPSARMRRSRPGCRTEPNVVERQAVSIDQIELCVCGKTGLPAGLDDELSSVDTRRLL